MIIQKNLSIIIPLYKGKKYLTSIRDELKENFSYDRNNKFKFEVIFINDYPNEEIDLKYLDQLFSFIEYKYLVNDKNYGVQYSRIKGTANASYEYILFLDQDDKIYKNYIYSQLNSIANFDAVLCNGIINRNGKVTNKIFKSELAMKKATNIKGYKYFSQIITPSLFVFKKSVIPEYWINNILKNNGSDDYYLIMCLFYNNVTFKINNDKILEYRIGEENFSSNKEKMRKSSLEVCSLLKKMDPSFFNKYVRKYEYNQELLRKGNILRSIYIFLRNPDLILNKVISKVTQK